MTPESLLAILESTRAELADATIDIQNEDDLDSTRRNLIAAERWVRLSIDGVKTVIATRAYLAAKAIWCAQIDENARLMDLARRSGMRR